MIVDVLALDGSKSFTVRNVVAVISFDSGHYGVILYSGSAYSFPPAFSLRIYNEKEKVKNG